MINENSAPQGIPNKRLQSVLFTLERHRKNYELRGSRRGVTLEFSEFFSTGFPCALPRMPISHISKYSIAFLHKENSEEARNSFRELAFLFRNSPPKKCTLNLRDGSSQEIKPRPYWWEVSVQANRFHLACTTESYPRYLLTAS